MVPFSYTLRSLFVRRSATLLTMSGIAAVVAVAGGVLSLQQGFQGLYESHGREDVAVFLRPGATYEGDSLFSRDRALKLTRGLTEVAEDASGPLASMECYLALLHPRVTGGETNVPVRGVQPATFRVRADEVRIVEGRNFTPGSDEVIIGQRLVGRVQDCVVGGVLELNLTPYRVVGVFESDGPADTEIWGDLDRLLVGLERIGPNRVIATLKPGADVEALAARLEGDKEVPAKVLTERDYLGGQTAGLSALLIVLAVLLALMMSSAALLTATNTMFAAVAARTHEIGILLAAGFRPGSIFLSFLLESWLLGLGGGVLAALVLLPLNGLETSTTNFQTFTEVAFSFRVTPFVVLVAVVFASGLGLFGGALPAWRAARMRAAPTKY